MYCIIYSLFDTELCILLLGISHAQIFDKYLNAKQMEKQ